MVRAHMKQGNDEKKDKKKTSSKKKSQETGVWPCKINGCNKEFAREADLKRHQRTTKLHSTPGLSVSCPQCEATFTRTDALRRHQKSRHNGVIMDPVNPDGRMKDGDDEGASPGSADHSRGGTPGRMNTSGSPSASMSSAVPTVLARPDTAGPGTGQQSYYRQHTVNPVFVAPRTPHGVLDQSGTYQPVPQLPTSATRLHGANWPPAPPWIQDNGQRPVPGQQYSIHGVYYPGAYYRAPNGQPGMGPGPEHQVPGQAPMSGNEAHTGPSDERQRSEGHVVSNSNIDPNLSGGSGNDADMKEGDGQRIHTAPDATSLNDHDGINAAVRKALEAVLAIDPKLNQPPAEPTTNTTPPTKEVNGQQSSNSDSALPQVQDTSQPATEQVSGTSNPQENGQIDPDTDMDADADGEADVEAEGEVEGQPPSGQMLTEDGEPMLRPDELLNEESLASPPPS